MLKIPAFVLGFVSLSSFAAPQIVEICRPAHSEAETQKELKACLAEAPLNNEFLSLENLSCEPNARGVGLGFASKKCGVYAVVQKKLIDVKTNKNGFVDVCLPAHNDAETQKVMKACQSHPFNLKEAGLNIEQIACQANARGAGLGFVSQNCGVYGVVQKLFIQNSTAPGQVPNSPNENLAH